MTPDPDPETALRTLARCAPHERIEREWPATRRADTLAHIIGTRTEHASDPHPVHEIPIRFIGTGAAVPGRRPRWARTLPLASGAAVTVAVAALVATMTSGGFTGSHAAGGPGGAQGPEFVPPAGLSTTASVGADQYAHQVDEQLDLDANGQPEPDGRDAMVNRNWISANGATLSIRTGSQNVCYQFSAPEAGVNSPSRAFLAGLPTDVDSLESYLRSHVAGSSSHDEAVFVAVGDMLRMMDGFASPALRAAMLAVLSRTAGVTVHAGQRDYLDRPALRADFVDQRIRPGEVQSLYFDPTTFQLLEQRDSSAGGSPTYAGPSPAYDAHSTDGPTAADLGGAAFLDVLRTVEAVDQLPAVPAGCRQG